MRFKWLHVFWRDVSRLAKGTSDYFQSFALQFLISKIVRILIENTGGKVCACVCVCIMEWVCLKKEEKEKGLRLKSSLFVTLRLIKISKKKISRNSRVNLNHILSSSYLTLLFWFYVFKLIINLRIWGKIDFILCSVNSTLFIK